ncbi:haloacid dehalogenase-like hydrolase [Butyricicoccus sp. Marseille-Q5471]|uniref:haloacid dehalogenase-like hydrolase n=1 Tax=Butyricicoccus sp. Marseille-Q5471 TaxID=3039493 RepID=UPI0024BC4860|nr:haloacid dehalogenase-like hydrolase [Butyricicoccus sp. Marseille-Q5471]
MKKRSSRVLSLCLAFLLGVITPIAIAAGVMANPGTTKILMNGKQASIAGYEIADNNYFKLRDLCEMLDVGVTYDAKTDTATIDPSQSYKLNSTTLMRGNWALETRAAMQAVIDANANKGKYVVFDFDNTTVINDVEEALLIYQIENLVFKIQPNALYGVLKTQIPDMNKVVGKNDAKRDVTCEQLAQDITADYKVLYNSYSGFGAGGTKDLTAIHATKEYQDFSAKLRYMYSAVGDTFDASVSYPWVTYLFTGMTSDEVYALAGKSHRYWSDYGTFTEKSWTSPDQGKAGKITASYLTGITFTEEVKDLYQTLMANNIDVYVVSASFIDVIRAAACDPYFGLNVPKNQVFAMELKKDVNGRYIADYNYDFGGTGKYAQTQAAGKSTVIENFIQPKYNGDGPLMVFGDSAGDYNMMTDFDDTVLGVIFNRYRKTSDPIWKCSVEASKTIGQANPRYVLQGRDNNIGQLIPTQYSRMLGSDDLVLVRAA